MSLQIDESGRRGRSRSPGGRRREERDHSRGPPAEAVPYPSPGGGRGDRDRDDAAAYEYDRLSSWRPASPAEEAPQHHYRSSREKVADDEAGYYRGSREKFADEDAAYYRGSRDEDASSRYGDPRRERDREPRYERERERDSDRERDRDRAREKDRDRYREKERDSDRDRDRERVRPDSFQYLPQKYAQKIADLDSPKHSRDSLPGRERERDRDGDRDRDRDRPRERDPRDRDRDSDRERERDRDRYRGQDRRGGGRDKYDDDLAYGSVPEMGLSRVEPPPHSRAEPPRSRADPPTATYKYADVKQYEYDKSDPSVAGYGREDPRYSASSLEPRQPAARAPSPGPGYTAHPREPKKYHDDSYAGADPRRTSTSVVTVEPGAAPRKSAMKRDSSPLPPTARMSNLSVDTGGGSSSLTVAGGHHRSGSMSLAAAPASPLLESYHGTYQSMSPMPSPMFLPVNPGGQLPEIHDAISPIGSEDERSGDKKRSRRARFHDPVDDAARLAKALKGERRAPETEPLIEILPGLTHEQVMELRSEYKRLVKTGSAHKGVNVAKHIRARLKDEDPSLMKACYAVALGQWESEAYWANFWYQGDKTRRELLIEALMGRTNDEIRAIKDGFSDKKYSNSLTKCMKTELKEDKFKKAVLLVLDEQRMDETDAYDRPLRIDHDLVRDDVKRLHHAVRSEKGGETLMITTVIQRSDSHLRAVLTAYTETYKSNFARDALKRSGNLVVSLSSPSLPLPQKKKKLKKKISESRY